MQDGFYGLIRKGRTPRGIDENLWDIQYSDIKRRVVAAEAVRQSGISFDEVANHATCHHPLVGLDVRSVSVTGRIDAAWETSGGTKVLYVQDGVRRTAILGDDAQFYRPGELEAAKLKAELEEMHRGRRLLGLGMDRTNAFGDDNYIHDKIASIERDQRRSDVARLIAHGGLDAIECFNFDPSSVPLDSTNRRMPVI